jgi:hypothetical protein
MGSPKQGLGLRRSWRQLFRNPGRGRACDRLYYAMTMSIHDLEFSRPAQFEFCDPGLGGA